MSPKIVRLVVSMVWLLFMALNCDAADKPIFGPRIDKGLIESDLINEASGIATSRKNLGVLWTHNDAGDPSRIYALNSQGEHLGVYTIDGVRARDWEDMALGPGPLAGEHYLYIGDIGDNKAAKSLKFIYRVPEPVVDESQPPADTIISGAEIITFQYPDGNRDAETLMIDPSTRDIYVVSKEEINVRVYRAPYPQPTTDTVILQPVATLDLQGAAFSKAKMVTAGDISISGLEILIKTYTTIYYWRRVPAQNLWQAFDNKPVKVPYINEPQGEAIAFASDGMGYYTMSEEDGGRPAHLYFYPRLSSPPPKLNSRGKRVVPWATIKQER